MATIQAIRKLALSFPEATEEPHFEKISFRFKKKIFMTVNTSDNLASLKLSVNDQFIFSKIEPSSIYPVPGIWGLQGWTLFQYDLIEKKILKEAIMKAYFHVAPASLRK